MTTIKPPAPSSEAAFGQPVNTVCDYRSARVILSLDSDFLQTEPGMIRATRLFSRGVVALDDGYASWWPARWLDTLRGR